MDQLPGEVTRLLLAWSQGDEQALAELMSLVYGELRRLAERQLHAGRRHHSLHTTELINEAFLRLVDQQHVEWRNRGHFYAVAAMMMRRVVVDLARARGADKRGGGVIKLSLDEIDDGLEISESRAAELVALDDALTGLQKVDPQLCRIVEWRFFGGWTVEEIAEFLQVSPRTVARLWELARAWLQRELARDN